MSRKRATVNCRYSLGAERPSRRRLCTHGVFFGAAYRWKIEVSGLGGSFVHRLPVQDVGELRCGVLEKLGASNPGRQAVLEKRLFGRTALEVTILMSRERAQTLSARLPENAPGRRWPSACGGVFSSRSLPRMVLLPDVATVVQEVRGGPVCRNDPHLLRGARSNARLVRQTAKIGLTVLSFDLRACMAFSS